MRIRRQYQFADALLDAASRLLRPEYRDWADAMRAESAYVSQNARLRWALGCFWAAIKLRFNPMNTGDYRVSRGVMLVEAIGAFGPLTFAWFEVVFGASGIVRFSGEIIDKFFFPFPGGYYILAMMFVSGVLGLLGPIGLVLGLRYALTGRGIENRALGWTLVSVPVVANLLGTVAGRFWGPPNFDVALTFSFLFAWLPAMVTLHLMWVAQPVHPSAPHAAAV